MSFSQLRFYNSTISQFNISLGWGNQESNLTVSLADDIINNDSFSPPAIGTPVLFNFGGWQYAGLLSRYSSSSSVSGHPVHEANVIDPRILLDGVQVILSDYTGVINDIPNLINLYGYLENQQFGRAQVNELGMPWNLIRNYLPILSADRIMFKGYKYRLDLSNLPLLSGYRIAGGPAISILEIINDVCEATSCDYFIKLESDLTTIKVYTSSRATQPMLGVISNYVTQTPNAKVREVGFEMVNEDNSKFVFGGKKVELFYSGGTPQWRTNGNDIVSTNEEGNLIWPYWGTDFDNNLIIGRGFGDYHTFTLDSRAVLIPSIGNTYSTNVGELRAVLADQLTWETYLWENCFNRYYQDDDGTERDNYYEINESGQFVRGTGTYKHSGYLNPLFKRAFDLGVIGAISDSIIAKFLNAENANVFLNTYTEQISNLINQGQLETEEKTPIEKLYELLKSYASEYYGRKFMCLVPQVQWYKDADTGEVYLSHEPLESGFVAEDVWNTGIANNLLPIDINQITTEDGKIQAFVRFDNADELELVNINPQDRLFGNFYKISDSRYTGNARSIFVKCTVDPRYVYLNNDTGASPRVVLTIDSPMFKKQVINTTSDTNNLLALFINDLWTKKKELHPNGGFTDENLKKVYVKLIKGIGGIDIDLYPMFVLPDLGAFGIQNNQATYGPWYEAGADGRVSVEADDNLVPWNFGGTYVAMNQNAQARFSDIALQQVAEYGRVEVPGIPSLNLGDRLLDSGPYVTDIQVSVGTDGYTTVYSFKTWTPRFGKVGRYLSDKIDRINRANQKIRRQMREQQKYNSMLK